MFLPHEVVGAFFRFEEKDLMKRFIGGPGVTRRGKSNHKTIIMFVPRQRKNQTCKTLTIDSGMYGY